MNTRIAVYWYFYSYSTGFNCFEGRSVNVQDPKTKILGHIGLTLIDEKSITN